MYKHVFMRMHALITKSLSTRGSMLPALWACMFVYVCVCKCVHTCPPTSNLLPIAFTPQSIELHQVGQ